MGLKATVEAVKSYKVSFGGESLGVYSEHSEWNGMVELRGSNGTLIVDRSLLDATFCAMFGHMYESVIIKASGPVLSQVLTIAEKAKN